MQAEALQPGRAGPRGDRIGRGAQATHRLPGARAERDPSLQRGGHGAREPRLLGRERVAPGVLVRPPAAAREEPPHAALHAREERRDVGIGGRRQPVEAGRAVGVARV